MNQYPTETIELPSKGLNLYPEGHPLQKGSLEMRYMTAKHEDILTNTNYLSQGIAIEKLLEALIVDKIDIDDLLIGDKNAVMIAARVLGYGPDYEITTRHPGTGRNIQVKVDLGKLDYKELDPTLFTKSNGEIDFTLPTSKNVVTIKLLTGRDTKLISGEINGLKKVNPEASYDVSVRLKNMIVAIDNNRDIRKIREYVDNVMRPGDSLALRNFANTVMPDVNMTLKYNFDNYGEEDIAVPLGVSFFWPTE